MSEQSRVPQPNYTRPETQFDRNGPARVAAREVIYPLAESPQGPFYFNDEVKLALAIAGIRKNANIADYGAGRGDTLFELLLDGYEGDLYALEPNAVQFGGMPYWEPTQIGSLAATKLHEKNMDEINAAYSNDHELHKMVNLESIIRVKSVSEESPLPDNFFDVVLILRSLALVSPNKQYKVLEIARKNLIVPTAERPSLVVLGMAGDRNKSGTDERPGLIEKEHLVAEILSQNERIGEDVVPPIGINTLFTTEDAEVMVPLIWKYSYIFKHVGEIVLSNISHLFLVMNSVRSLRDRFMTKSGRKLIEPMFDAPFEEALAQAFWAERKAILEEGKVVRLGETHRSLILASDRELTIDRRKFTEIPRAA